MSNVIQVLPEENFQTFKEWISDKGRNPVFVASFLHPNEPNPIDMYVKIYPMTVEDRSIFNEIVGYLMANALTIPQPKYACIAFISIAEIMRNDTVGFFDTPLGQYLQQFEVYPVFCTTKIDKSLTAFEYALQVGDITSSVLTKELMACPDYSRAVAMDGTIAHIDRHLNNLLRTGKNRYHFIDNDQLVEKYQDCGWRVTDLEVNKKYRNKLYIFAMHAFNQRQLHNLNSRMVECSLTHSEIWELIAEELSEWKSKLYFGNEDDYNEFIHFLAQRCNSAYAQATSRAQLLL